MRRGGASLLAAKGLRYFPELERGKTKIASPSWKHEAAA
jgi:hypothetical protein